MVKEKRVLLPIWRHECNHFVCLFGILFPTCANHSIYRRGVLLRFFSLDDEMRLGPVRPHSATDCSSTWVMRPNVVVLKLRRLPFPRFRYNDDCYFRSS